VGHLLVLPLGREPSSKRLPLSRLKASPMGHFSGSVHGP
jgi:hypothetical protein